MMPRHLGDCVLHDGRVDCTLHMAPSVVGTLYDDPSLIATRAKLAIHEKELLFGGE